MLYLCTISVCCFTQISVFEFLIKVALLQAPRVILLRSCCLLIFVLRRSITIIISFINQNSLSNNGKLILRHNSWNNESIEFDWEAKSNGDNRPRDGERKPLCSISLSRASSICFSVCWRKEANSSFAVLELRNGRKVWMLLLILSSRCFNLKIKKTINAISIEKTTKNFTLTLKFLVVLSQFFLSKLLF